MAGEKREREYVRVPNECSAELRNVSSRYDVPLESVTRLVLCLGLETLGRVDDTFVRECLSRLAVPSQAAAATR